MHVASPPSRVLGLQVEVTPPCGRHRECPLTGGHYASWGRHRVKIVFYTPTEGQPLSWGLLLGPSHVPVHGGWPGVRELWGREEGELFLPAPEVRAQGEQRALGLEWPLIH